MILHIKNMVCDRCKMVVADLFKQINISPIKIDLTEIEISEELTEEQATEVFELIDRMEDDDDVQAVYHTMA